MKASPLTFKDISFIRISVESDHNYKKRARAYDFDGTEYKLNIRHGRSKDSDSNWWVGVEYATRSNEEKICPYELDMLAVGIFSVAENFPNERAEKLVYENGAALVFSAIREMVSTLTGRSTYGQFILPTVSFLGEFENRQDHQAGEESESSASD